nr:uncharacterized protein LOC132417479 [Delphinus delphis]
MRGSCCLNAGALPSCRSSRPAQTRPPGAPVPCVPGRCSLPRERRDWSARAEPPSLTRSAAARLTAEAPGRGKRFLRCLGWRRWGLRSRGTSHQRKGSLLPALLSGPAPPLTTVVLCPQGCQLCQWMCFCSLGWQATPHTLGFQDIGQGAQDHLAPTDASADLPSEPTSLDSSLAGMKGGRPAGLSFLDWEVSLTLRLCCIHGTDAGRGPLCTCVHVCVCFHLALF